MNRPRRYRASKLAIFAIAVTSTGCFRYVPAQLDTTPAGTGVRIMVTRQGADELASVMDVDDNAPVINGTVESVQGNDLLLHVPVGQRQDGFMVTKINQTIRVPTGEIVSFHRKEFNKTGTAFVMAAGLALVTTVVFFIADPLGNSTTPPDDPPELQLRLGLFSIPFGF